MRFRNPVWYGVIWYTVGIVSALVLSTWLGTHAFLAVFVVALIGVWLLCIKEGNRRGEGRMSIDVGDSGETPPEQLNRETRLPRYRCHKVVEALKIGAIQDLHIFPVDTHYRSFFVSRAYLDKHQPHAGGWWVRYADGYESFSPAKAFEEGYTRIEDELG